MAKPIVLCILDGWGEWNMAIGNPLLVARLPTINWLNSFCPKLLLEASGLAVGLPWGVMGNSEVGHQTMGAGQIVFEASPTIDMSIQSGDFFKNPILNEALEKARTRDSALHLWGLLSDGGVHSRLPHLFALLDLAKKKGLTKVFVHAVTDGRDVPPQSAKDYLIRTAAYLAERQVGRLATVCGRYYAMDRNQNWDRTEKYFSALTACQGEFAGDLNAAVDQFYRQKITDEFFTPLIITDENGTPVARIKDDDVVVCFNFRGDRTRQLTRAFTDKNFTFFSRVARPANIHYAGFTQYEEGLTMPVAFPASRIKTRLGEIISAAGLRQLRIAETEKFAHVTYFFNGGQETAFPNEDRILVPSKNVPSYAQLPAMSAKEITVRLVAAIASGRYDFILVNYANPDMVGHTGNFSAAVRAVTAVDQELNTLIQAVHQAGGSLLITADHGNVEEMINIQTGEPDTKHSSNPVPCWLVSPPYCYKQPLPAKLLPVGVEGMLVDIAPTILNIINLGQDKKILPGRSLLPFFQARQEQAAQN